MRIALAINEQRWNMILEGIMTTINRDGGVNISPMGPIVDAAMSQFKLRPFQTSTRHRQLSSGFFLLIPQDSDSWIKHVDSEERNEIHRSMCTPENAGPAQPEYHGRSDPKFGCCHSDVSHACVSVDPISLEARLIPACVYLIDINSLSGNRLPMLQFLYEKQLHHRGNS